MTTQTERSMRQFDILAYAKYKNFPLGDEGELIVKAVQAKSLDEAEAAFNHGFWVEARSMGLVVRSLEISCIYDIQAIQSALTEAHTEL